MGRHSHAQIPALRTRLEIGAAAFCIGIGLSGLPLEPWRVLATVGVCTLLAAFAGRFIAAIALVVTIGAGYLQHHQLRVTFFIAAALAGAFARYAEKRPLVATGFAIAGFIAGAAALLLLR